VFVNKIKYTIKLQHLKLHIGTGKADTLQTMNSYGKVEIQMCSFLIWKLGSVNGELCAPASLPLAKERPLSNRRMHAFQNPSGCFGEEIKLAPMPGKEPRFLGRPNHNIIFVSAVVFQLAFYICHLALLNIVCLIRNFFSLPQDFCDYRKNNFK
jgi:hypothetical protein